jgi:DNA-binding FadR family transcriptional regulator
MEASLSQPEAFLQANLNWHLAIARATGNDLLAAFLSALSQPIYEGTDATFLNSDEVRMQTFRAHEAIMHAVIARDVEAAERRMRRHVSAYGEVMKKHPTKTSKASRAPRPRAARQVAKA